MTGCCPSRNFATLIGLSVILVAAYLLQGYLDAARSRMLARIGALFDAELQKPIYASLAMMPLKGAPSAAVMQPLRDLEMIRAFLSGMGPTAFLDMPWIPIFMLALFIFHPLIGVAATLGAALIIATTLLAERQSKKYARCGNGARNPAGSARRSNRPQRRSRPCAWDEGPLHGGMAPAE